MKQVLIIILASAQLFAFSQINLDKTYEGSAGLSKINENTFYFYNFDTTYNQCVIYNEQHEQIKTIDVPLTNGQYLSSITYLSEDLFDLDAELELVYTYTEWQLVDTTWYLYYGSNILNEDGSIMAEIPGAEYINVTNTNDGSSLLAWIYDFSLSSYPIETQAYHLPGNYSAIDENKSLEQQNAWPNPCSQNIYLPIETGASSIQVYNEQGQLIDVIQPSSTDQSVKYSVNHLSKGIYFFQSNFNNKKGETRKFIIH